MNAVLVPCWDTTFIVITYRHLVLAPPLSMDTLPAELLQRIAKELHLSIRADKVFMGDRHRLQDDSDTVRIRWGNAHMSAFSSSSWLFRKTDLGTLFSIVDVHCPGGYAGTEEMKYVAPCIDRLPNHQLEAIRSAV